MNYIEESLDDFFEKLQLFFYNEILEKTVPVKRYLTSTNLITVIKECNSFITVNFLNYWPSWEVGGIELSPERFLVLFSIKKVVSMINKL